MAHDPFAGMTDTFLDRTQRVSLPRRELRNQQWRAFGISIGVMILVAAATGLGGAIGGWVIEQNLKLVSDRFLGGAVCGLLGGFFSFCYALWRVMRRVVLEEILGEDVQIDIGATLFWATVAGAVLFGSLGATLGLAGRADWRFEALGCAIGSGLLAMIPARMLRQAMNRTSRSSSGSTLYRKSI
jgi:hypothetical protein